MPICPGLRKNRTILKGPPAGQQAAVSGIHLDSYTDPLMIHQIAFINSAPGSLPALLPE